MIEFYLALPLVGKIALWLILFMLSFLGWIIWEAERSPTYLDEEMTQRVDDDDYAEPKETSRNESSRQDRPRAPTASSRRTSTLRAIAGREVRPTQKEREG